MFAIGIGLAGFSPIDLCPMVLASGWVLGGAGVLCCIATAFIQPKTITNPLLQASFIQTPHFKKKQVCLLWLGQIAFISISFILFHFLETQTQIDTRLFFVETGYITRVLQQDRFSLGMLPFILYGVLGSGLAYFSVCVGRKPFLARAFLLSQESKRMTKFILFSQNFLSIVVAVVIMMTFVLVASFALFWLCETINTYLGLKSLFNVPLQTVFILGMMIFVFQRINKQLIAWMGHHHISVGQVLIIYILTFAFFVSWLHSAADWLTLAIKTSSIGEEKSYFAGMFDEKSLHLRIQYLIWGWWSIWIPWMASWVGRSSIGFSIPRAFIHALVLPTIVFGWGIQQLGVVEWNFVYHWLEWPSVQLLGLFAIFLSMWIMWNGTYNMGDVLRGAMPSIGRDSNRSLTRWMTALLFWLTCYIPGSFMLGWLPMQLIVTLGGLFMMGVLTLLIGAWGTSLYRLWALKKCRVPL